MNLEDLKPSNYNPRAISDEALRALEHSIGEFGDISGLVWNRRTGHLVCGHQRMKALREKYGDGLRMEDGAVVTPDGERFSVRVVDWPEAKEKAANVAANSQLLAGEFTANLSDLLEEIKIDRPDLAMELRLDELDEEKYFEVTSLELEKPIETVWVLMGLPVQAYQRVAETLEQIGQKQATFYDTTVR